PPSEKSGGRNIALEAELPEFENMVVQWDEKFPYWNRTYFEFAERLLSEVQNTKMGNKEFVKRVFKDMQYEEVEEVEEGDDEEVDEGDAQSEEGVTQESKKAPIPRTLIPQRWSLKKYRSVLPKGKIRTMEDIGVRLQAIEDLSTAYNLIV